MEPIAFSYLESIPYEMNYTYQLENHPIVGSYEVTRYDTEDDAVILKIRLVVVDGSILRIKEYTDLCVRNYSFH